MNYTIRPYWDTNLALIFTLGDVSNQALTGLAFKGVYTVTGAPAAVANRWIPGATVENAIDGTIYINSGTTASPVWVLMDTGEAFTLPDSVTDSTTTTGTSLAFILSALTTGVGQIITAAAATAATIYKVVANALTTGIVYQAIASAMTTGRYYSANNGTTEVFGVGVNGHLISTVGVAPTIAVGTANGITAAAITSGGTDTCGTITTIGTNNNAGATVLNVTFGKTYTVAPKIVLLTGANQAGAKASGTGSTVIGNNAFISAISATGFSLTIPADDTAEATPSFHYAVIA